MYHHRVVAIEQFVEPFAARLVQLNDLQIHVVGCSLSHADSRLSAAHYNDVLHVGIVFLARDFTNIWDVLASGHEVGDVVHMQLVVTTWYQRVVVALDGHHVIRVVGAAELFQRLVQYLARLTQLDAQHDECAPVNVPALTYPRHLQAVGDVNSCQYLRVDE